MYWTKPFWWAWKNKHLHVCTLSRSIPIQMRVGRPTRAWGLGPEPIILIFFFIIHVFSCFCVVAVITMLADLTGITLGWSPYTNERVGLVLHVEKRTLNWRKNKKPLLKLISISIKQLSINIAHVIKQQKNQKGHTSLKLKLKTVSLCIF